MSLDATPAGPDSNSFVDVAFADDYNSERLFNQEWADASVSDKEASLIRATFTLDQMDWIGYLNSDTDQALRFPREELTDRDGRELTGIPTFLGNATCELALSYLRTEVVSPEAATKRVKVSSIEMEYFEKQVSPGQLPDTVRYIVAPYLSSGTNTVNILRG